MKEPPRRVVLVTGAPGSGKSTLASPLGAELGFALFAKDRIKETLADVLGDGAGELAWSKRLGAASMELLWALAVDALAVVLEAAFWPDDERHERHLRELGAHTGEVRAVEVHCVCPPAVAMRRYAERLASRHAVHADAHRVVSPDAWAKWTKPVGLGELVSVDTSAPVDVAGLASEVRTKLDAFPQAVR
ncbi:MAG: AAA family ATPase [Nocardiopsaceae bacterium]|jgi:predicted kinase|nr:AAA family ATPase [Nocardiopsaceae bacterium]